MIHEYIREWLRYYDSPGYRMICQHYGDKTAARSGVKLMDHINQGLVWMLSTEKVNGMQLDAWCIHPIVQSDAAFLESGLITSTEVGSWTWTLALEYRRAANAYLCKPLTDSWTDADAKSQIGEIYHDIRMLLLADKLQNQADFIKHHKGTHPRSKQLTKYFERWLRILDADVEKPFVSGS